MRRRPGEEYNPECVVTTTKHPTKIMVFGAIQPAAKSDLIFIKGNVDAAKYQNVLKKADIQNFVKWGRQRLEFMEDGAPAHKANSTKKFQ